MSEETPLVPGSADGIPLRLKRAKEGLSQAQTEEKEEKEIYHTEVRARIALINARIFGLKTLRLQATDPSQRNDLDAECRALNKQRAGYIEILNPDENMFEKCCRCVIT